MLPESTPHALLDCFASWKVLTQVRFVGTHTCFYSPSSVAGNSGRIQLLEVFVMIARVHWLLWNLSPKFKGFYKLRFDYRFHSYVFYRNYYSSKRLLEFYSIVRTSKKCFRLMYYTMIIVIIH